MFRHLARCRGLRWTRGPVAGRTYSTAPAKLSAEDEAMLSAEREAMAYDVVVVGAGPAGLATAIRIKQLCAASGKEFSVGVVEKASEVGAHILSGNVFEPRALDELLPAWRESGAPVGTEAANDSFLALTETGSIAIPNLLLPPQLHNEGNYIISLSQLARWLGEQAEALGVDILPGFSASEVLYNEDGSVKGIATRDVGINKDGTPMGTFTRGTELHARQTVFAEGCRGSCSEAVMQRFDLRAEAQPQTYGIGLKEVWEVPEANMDPGLIQHTLGWPLQHGPFAQTFGGSFLYHMAPNYILVGFVVGLDYENPYISPYQEFQRWKHHPEVAKHLEGGTRIQYGARCLNEGGYHALPKLTFPGGALVGCSAGFLNSVKIKGTHLAIKSGAVCGEEIFNELAASDDEPCAETYMLPEGYCATEVTAYQTALEASWAYDEMKEVRNCHAAFHWGFLPGMVYTALATFLFKGKEPWTISNSDTDAAKTGLASKYKEIEYPKPDGKLSFDLLTNLSFSGTDHNEQPSHLRIKPELAEVPEAVSLQVFAGPEQRFCPAKVYAYDEHGKLEINAQNCLHCKACSIKMPSEYIDWTVPEGGGGPKYSHM